MTSHTQDEVMLKLEDWFDPYNPEHMKAYEVLCKTCAWPKEFLAADLEIPMLCVPSIQAKIAQAWLHAMKHGQIIGSAPF